MGVTARAVAVVAALVGALLTVAQLLIIAASFNDAVAQDFFWRAAAFTQALIGLEFTVVGALIALRRPDNRIGWLLLGGGLGLCMYSFVSEYALYGALVSPGALPASGIAAVLSQTTWAVPFAVLPLVLLLFPTGRPLSRTWGFAGLPAIAGAAVVVILGTVIAWPMRHSGRDLLLQAEQADNAAAMGLALGVGTVLLLASVVPAMLSIVVRWRRARGVERLQLRWLVPTGALIVTGSLLNGLLANGSAWGEIALQAGLFSTPAAVAVAVLRYRLYDIDRIISRVISYAVVSGVVAIVYIAVAVLPSTLLNLDSNVLIAAATLAAAATFVPVRRRVQTAVDRRFNRARYDARLVVDEFRSQTREHVDLDGLVVDLRDAVTLTVQPASAVIWIRSGS